MREMRDIPAEEKSPTGQRKGNALLRSAPQIKPEECFGPELDGNDIKQEQY